jgi:hypothetical protein
MRLSIIVFPLSNRDCRLVSSGAAAKSCQPNRRKRRVITFVAIGAM